MRDYNHDGKVDHHDSSIFHNYINTSEDSANNSSSSSSGKLGGGAIGILIGILVVFEIVKSGIISGPFAGLLGLACIVGLFFCFGAGWSQNDC